MTQRQHVLMRGAITAILVVLVSCMGPVPVQDDGRPSPPDDPPADRVNRVYRVQVGLFDEKSAADRTVQRAVQWWQSLEANDRPSPLRDASELPVDVHWRAPYYRVRIGPFSDRSRAERVLQAVQDRFPDAFVAPDRIAARSAERTW